MKCDKCQNEASFFYNETRGGKTRALSLCADCARAAGFLAGGAAKSLENDLYSVLFGGKQSPAKTCKTCGKTWSAISASGTVGCAACYETFREELARSIRRMHGNTQHVGRVPAAQKEVREGESRVAALREALKAAIASENFEEAAKLRDEIRNAEGV